MYSVEILRDLFGRGKSSSVETSRKMGRSDSFIANYLSTKRVPNTDLFAEILDALGYDLIMRDRGTGEETIVGLPRQD